MGRCGQTRRVAGMEDGTAPTGPETAGGVEEGPKGEGLTVPFVKDPTCLLLGVCQGCRDRNLSPLVHLGQT